MSIRKILSDNFLYPLMNHNMKKKTLLTFLGIIAFLFSGNSFAIARVKIINGIDANFPPFAYIDQAGKSKGFDIEALDWIADEMGYEVVHKAIDWDNILTSLLDGGIDIVASGMSITLDRLKKVNFSLPYWKIHKVMVVKRDSTVTVADLMKSNMLVGAQQGTPEAEWLKGKIREWPIQIKGYKSSHLAIIDILNGRISAAAMDDVRAKEAVHNNAVKSIGPFGMDSEDFGYAVRKDDLQLLNDMNEGLKRLMASQFWEDLIKKYNLKAE